MKSGKLLFPTLPLLIFCTIVFLSGSTVLIAQTRQILPGHVPRTRLQPVGRLAGQTNLYLSIALPLRNRAELSQLISDLYEPTNPQFRHWLTPGQFTQRFGPSAEDYQKVIRFSERNGLKVLAQHPNRLLLDVTGPVSQIEKAFQVRLSLYPHPTEARMFYAPDTEPTVDADVPILHVAGLNNYSIPRPMDLKLREHALRERAAAGSVTPYATGSGPSGDFTGKDFRAAYAPGVSNQGAGQYIAIVDVGGPYYPKDIYMYETNAGFSTNIAVTNILLSGWTGVPVGTNADDGEETLDIDMALSMAPQATILNYEGEAHDVFNRIATDNLAKQITLSYGFGIDASIQQMFLEFIAQGQAFFQASGDGGADLPGGTGLTGEPYATIVGGTSLTTSGPAGSWLSETTWIGSGGGISGYGIPAWQEGVDMTANLGSTTNRNYPDVAMLADTVIWWYFKNGVGATVGGTSASSPQWAGFMALANQAAAAQGMPPVGFLNPAVYTLGKQPYAAYAGQFHDITTGNSFNSQNPARFSARSGYDLCTGWGSPRGNATIAALIGFGTNDFTLTPTSAGLNIVPGGTATTVLQPVALNGFKGTITLSITGLPNNVLASLAPTVTTNATVLTLATSSSAIPGSYDVIIKASSAGLTHTLTLKLNLVLPFPGANQVLLSSYFNRGGIYDDGQTFAGGIDGSGFACSAQLLGPRPNAGNILFQLAPVNANNVIACAGQTIALGPGRFTTLHLLATAVNGNQNNQPFTVAYSDNSTTTLLQNFSDWVSPQRNPNESVALNMPYRDASNGTQDRRTFYLYDYALTLNQTNPIKSLKLPNNGNVVILAMTLANGHASASLAGFYNRAGMYTDGTTFTNPPTGGLDGGGAALSATLLGGAQSWNGVEFNFGPANATNVISCAGQTIPLPPGNYSALRLLGTGVQGNQPAQNLTVTYADGATTSLVQGFSDWFTPQNYAGESKAVLMGHRNSANGTKDNRTFYLYGYSFPLNSAKIVQSFRLPNNLNVIVASASLVPNWPPAFVVTPFSEPQALAGRPYSATLATNATDLNGDALTFAKLSGPAWLTVAADGTLGGTPLPGDAGLNTFAVSATDPGNLATTASMNITVAAPILVAISARGPGVLLNWSGGAAPYRVQVSSDLGASNWTDLAASVSSNSLSITPTNNAAFYRVLSP